MLLILDSNLLLLLLVTLLVLLQLLLELLLFDLNLLRLPPCSVSSFDGRGLATLEVTVCVAMVRRVIVLKLTVYASTSRFMLRLQ